MFYSFVKQTEKQPKQIEFRFETNKKFDCFEDTLSQSHVADFPGDKNSVADEGLAPLTSVEDTLTIC